MADKFKFIESYYDVTEIKNYFFNKIKDDLSGGPTKSKFSAYGYNGCWDIPLRLENDDNPIHQLIEKLKEDFGDFTIIPTDASIRLMSYPFTVHSDLSSALLAHLRSVGATTYKTFLIPLSWEQPSTPGTAFFNSPPRLDEPLYKEKLDILPHYSEEARSEMDRYSVAAIYKWKNPGDLVAWDDFVYHSTLDSHDYQYSLEPNNIAKKFISMRVYSK